MTVRVPHGSDKTPESNDREFFSSVTVEPAKRLSGSPRIPGDKSISHRMLLFGALAHGKTHIRNLLDAADVRSSRGLIEALGVRVVDDGETVVVHGAGPASLHAPAATIDCGNSGTTMRLGAGLLAGLPFASTLDGDASLRRRPMKRVADPLRLLGARLDLSDGRLAPFTVHGGGLRGTTVPLAIASAQVKSAVILAALNADGDTILEGELAGRDHTERLLAHFGADLKIDTTIRVRGGTRLHGADLRVPGDPSSAAFWIAAAAIVPGASVTMHDVGINPTRMGFVRALQRMGARLTVKRAHSECEPTGLIVSEHGPLRGVTITPQDVPAIVDELPLIAVLACYADGVTEVRGAHELRVKESDRIAAIAHDLEALGATVEVFDDGFRIVGPQPLRGAEVKSFGDHRIAMAMAIAALGASSPVTIDDASCVDISYPSFFPTLRYLTGATQRAGVLGASLAHSRSPEIHAWIGRAIGVNLAYERLERPAGDLAPLFGAIRRDAAYAGINVTIPHKERAAQLVDRLARTAQAVGAVNVVARRGDGSLEGHNTDVAGVLATLDRHAIDVRDARVCVLGAGGAAAAVVYALAQRAPAEVVIVNRTPDRARTLAARLRKALPGLNLVAPDAPDGAFALVVDATPGGVQRPEITPGGWAFDLKYGGEPSPFLRDAAARGANTVNGLEMLAAQALATHEIWFRDGQPFPPGEARDLMDGLLAHLHGAR
jgi:3-phosphoshikimate 1-carboxyvinyltransferase